MVAVVSGTGHCPPMGGGITGHGRGARVRNTNEEHPGSTALRRRQSTPTDQMFQPTPRSTSPAPATRRHTHTSAPLSTVLLRLRPPQALFRATDSRQGAGPRVGRAAGHAGLGHAATCRVVSREGSRELPALVYRCVARAAAEHAALLARGMCQASRVSAQHSRFPEVSVLREHQYLGHVHHGLDGAATTLGGSPRCRGTHVAL